jgi:hypothetical protein
MSRQATAWMLGVGMVACLAIATPTNAEPFPIEGRLGVLSGIPLTDASGLEAELAWRDTPWSGGVLGWTRRGVSSRTAWARFAMPVTEGGRLGLIVGGNDFPESTMCQALGLCPPATRYGILVALSYVLRTERLWMRLTPQYVFPIDGGTTDSNQAYIKSGLPWAEVGIRAMPWLDVSVRVSEMPLAVTVVF